MGFMEFQQMTDNNVHEDDNSEDVLLDDLETALSSRFSFEGSFAYVTRMAQAPNPCLNVEGVGLIGLPLSDRDAMLIAKCSLAETSYGHSAKVLTEENGRDTWEIDFRKVSFWNKDWGMFHSWAVQTACHGLGLRAYQPQLRCGWHKLVLYGPGSHSLLHPDDQQVHGEFATMLVVLPSFHTGGEVCVSHGTKSKTLDLAQDSRVSTSILAWYADAPHEAKPIVLGYRLAISYKLINISNPLPPIISQLDRLTQNLRETLRKWRDGVYKTLPRDSFVAYLLEHQCSEWELRSGIASLKGADAHKVSFLRPIAEELGYTVCLGNLKCEVSGATNYRYIKWECKKNDRSDSDSDPETSSDDDSMAETHHIRMGISCVVNLNGVRILKKELSVNNESLVPENPFEDVKPDKEEKEDEDSDKSNSEATSSYCYLRTVVILIREQDTLNVLCSDRADGFDYGVVRLKESNNVSPTQMDKDTVYAMLRNLKSRPKYSGYSFWSDKPDRTPQDSKIMIDYALKWNDVEMWSAIMEQCVLGTQYVGAFGTNFYFESWDKFSFSKVEHYEIASTIISQTAQLRERVHFIDAIRIHASKVNGAISEDWYKQKLIEALSTFKITSRSDDVDALLHVIATWGMQLVQENVILPMSKKQGSFDFWLHLIQTMIKKKSTLCMPPADGEAETSGKSHPDASSKLCSESEFNAILNGCINIIAPRWNINPSSSRNSKPDDHKVQAEKINRVIQILDVCFLANCPEPCCYILASVLEINPQTGTDILPSRFQNLYIPLVPKFIDLLKKHNIALTFSPFDAFLRKLIRLYLQYILGPTQSLTQEVAKSHSIGCGKCTDCDELDRFMADINQKTIVFRMNGSRRFHLEGFLSPTRGKRCDWTTIKDRAPHALHITKTDDYLASMSWERRRAAAVMFLQSFGNDVLLQALMGPLWNDVLASLEGLRPFGSSVHPPHHTSPPPPPPPPPPHLLGPTMVPPPARVPPFPIGAVNIGSVAQPPNLVPNPIQQHQARQWHPQTADSLQHVHIPEPPTPSIQITNQSSHEAVQDLNEPAKKRQRLHEPHGAGDVSDIIDQTKES